MSYYHRKSCSLQFFVVDGFGLCFQPEKATPSVLTIVHAVLMTDNIMLYMSYCGTVLVLVLCAVT